MDLEGSYKSLFELLWYSQLPCFNVLNITSEKDDYGKLPAIIYLFTQMIEQCNKFQLWSKGAYGKVREWVAQPYSLCTPQIVECAAHSTSKKQMSFLGPTVTKSRLPGWPNRTRTIALRTQRNQIGETKSRIPYTVMHTFSKHPARFIGLIELLRLARTRDLSSCWMPTVTKWLPHQFQITFRDLRQS